MAAITLTEAMGVEQPALNWRWLLNLDFLGIDGKSLSTPISAIFVQDVQIPLPSIEIRPRYRGGNHLYFPGTVNVDSFTVTFFETEDFKILKALRTWQSLIIQPPHDVTGTLTDVNNLSAGLADTNSLNGPTAQGFKAGNYGLPAVYFGSMSIDFFSTKDNTTPTFTIYVGGVWPAKISDMSLSYSAHSGNITTICQFACNFVELAGNSFITSNPNFSNNYTPNTDIDVSSSPSTSSTTADNTTTTTP